MHESALVLVVNVNWNGSDWNVNDWDLDENGHWNEAIAVVRKLAGGTEPTTSDVGTIRGDLTINSYRMANVDSRAVRNLIHCSDKPEEAEREIKIWFKKDEQLNYRLLNEEILYDINLDGILE